MSKRSVLRQNQLNSTGSSLSSTSSPARLAYQSKYEKIKINQQTKLDKLMMVNDYQKQNSRSQSFKEQVLVQLRKETDQLIRKLLQQLTQTHQKLKQSKSQNEKEIRQLKKQLNNQQQKYLQKDINICYELQRNSKKSEWAYQKLAKQCSQMSIELDYMLMENQKLTQKKQFLFQKNIALAKQGQTIKQNYAQCQKQKSVIQIQMNGMQKLVQEYQTTIDSLENQIKNNLNVIQQRKTCTTDQVKYFSQKNKQINNLLEDKQMKIKQLEQRFNQLSLKQDNTHNQLKLELQNNKNFNMLISQLEDRLNCKNSTLDQIETSNKNKSQEIQKDECLKYQKRLCLQKQDKKKLLKEMDKKYRKKYCLLVKTCQKQVKQIKKQCSQMKIGLQKQMLVCRRILEMDIKDYMKQRYQLKITTNY